MKKILVIQTYHSVLKANLIPWKCKQKTGFLHIHYCVVPLPSALVLVMFRISILFHMTPTRLGDSKLVLTALKTNKQKKTKDTTNHVFIKKNDPISSHIVMYGNEKAAKKALNNIISNIKIPYTDLKGIIHKKILKNKNSKNIQINAPKTKLQRIQPNIEEWKPGPRMIKDKTIWANQCLDYTLLLHIPSCLKKQYPPICRAYQKS